MGRGEGILKGFIVKSFDVICQFGVFILMLSGLVAGYGEDKVIGAIGGLIAGTIMSVLIFGVLFIFMEIRDNTRKTAAAVASISHASKQPE